MSAAHTPGPWSLSEHSANQIVAGRGHNRMGVACVYEVPINTSAREIGDRPEWQRGLANAHLIAAAPELLDSARLLEGLCQWMLHRFGVDSPEAREAGFRLEKVSRAIARATGAA